MRPFISLSVLLLLSQLGLSQTGSIKGRVTSKSDGEPLVGVNVLVQGSLRGSSANSNGEYEIKNVAAGEYSLLFSLVGFQRIVGPHVVVADGETTTVNMELDASLVQTEQIVVTASKREQSLQEVPVSVSVMGAKEIAHRNSVTVDDALRYVPGVNMTEYSVNIRGSSGYSRGAGSRVLMLVDGIPFLTGDTGELNFETIPAGQVERIEVVKGASSALYGSSALGGVINVITRAISDEPETRVRLYGGLYGKPSFSEWDWNGGNRFNDGQALSHARKFGDLGISLFVSRMADDGYRQNDFRRRYNGFLKLKYDLSSQDAVTTTFNILHQRRGSFLYWRDLNHALTPLDSQQGDRVRSTRFYFSSLYNHIVSDKLLYNVKAMWFRNDWSDTIDQGENNSKSDVLRAEVQMTWTPDALHILTYGVEGNYDRVNADLFGTRNGAGFAIFAQDELQLTDQFKATIGARFDFQDLDSLASNSQLNPKVGFVYALNAGTALRASFGMGFRTPAVAEAFTKTSISGLEVIPNPALKPERSFSIEVGASHVFSDVALVDVALFHSEFKNLIEAGFTLSGKGQFNNVTRARIQGGEASMKLGFFNGDLLFNVSYTYVFPKDVSKDDILKYRPRHLLYANVLARFGALSAGVDFRYVSNVERIDDEFVRLGIVKDGNERGPAYVTDVRFSADFSQLGVPCTASVNINNIFQYNYVELIGNIMPPRNTVLVIEVRL